MIEPSVGRIVWYHPHAEQGGDINGQPHAAIVAHVINERLVNLAVINENGSLYARQQVDLLQDDDAAPAEGDYAEWMPFQKGQAVKTETAEGGAAKLIADLATDVDGKFKSLGDWLQPRLAALELKVNGSAPPAADPSGAGMANTDPPQGQATA